MAVASYGIWDGLSSGVSLIAQADVVLALGTRLGPFGTLPQHGLDYWPRQAKIIQIDSDPRVLGLVKPISVGLQADARAAAAALLERLRGRTLAGTASRAERLARIAAEKAAWEAELTAKVVAMMGDPAAIAAEAIKAATTPQS